MGPEVNSADSFLAVLKQELDRWGADHPGQ
jgi:hypothetical protein